VDAAESKRRDIGADPMLISSNTGFDPLAIRKAKRTGIGLISVLKQGDDRLRGVIEEEIYLRKVVVSEVTVRFDGPPVKNRPKINRPDDLRYREDTVSDWLALRMVQACTGIATSGPLTLSYRLKQRTNFRAPGGRQFPATKISISFHANVEWRSQIVQLDATNAIYDYVRGRVRPVGSQGSYTLRDVSFDLATPLPEPPPTEAWTAGLKPGEMTIGLAYVSGRGVPTKIIPQSKAITDLIQPEDLVDLPVLFAKTPQ
jgi:hypothetical protein